MTTTTRSFTNTLSRYSLIILPSCLCYVCVCVCVLVVCVLFTGAIIHLQISPRIPHMPCYYFQLSHSLFPSIYLALSHAVSSYSFSQSFALSLHHTLFAFLLLTLYMEATLCFVLCGSILEGVVISMYLIVATDCFLISDSINLTCDVCVCGVFICAFDFVCGYACVCAFVRVCVP